MGKRSPRRSTGYDGQEVKVLKIANWLKRLLAWFTALFQLEFLFAAGLCGFGIWRLYDVALITTGERIMDACFIVVPAVVFVWMKLYQKAHTGQR